MGLRRKMCREWVRTGNGKGENSGISPLRIAMRLRCFGRDDLVNEVKDGG